MDRDDKLARCIGLELHIGRNPPDAILVDFGPVHPPLFFVEAVATDGLINDRRKKALGDVASDAGFPLQHVAFVTAYLDRSGTAFNKTLMPSRGQLCMVRLGARAPDRTVGPEAALA